MFSPGLYKLYQHDWRKARPIQVPAEDSGSHPFATCVCPIPVSVFRFPFFFLYGPSSFHQRSYHISPFSPLHFLCSVMLSSISALPCIVRFVLLHPCLSHSPYVLFIFHIIMYAHVCGCGSAASFASLQVCLPFFRLFLFFVCCFRMGPFLFPSLYARANIIMCVSFSSGVLRYKNMLCNTSVIQSITKKFQEIRIIFPSYVCWLSLKGLPLHPQSREMRHFRQCVTDLVKQT
mgnify:FL=1